jgi:hypothetical protein
VPLVPETARIGKAQSAPGRTRTCATGSGGPFDSSTRSRPSCSVHLNWALSPSNSWQPSRSRLLDRQKRLPIS